MVYGIIISQITNHVKFWPKIINSNCFKSSEEMNFRKLVEEGGMLAGTSAGIMALTDDVIITGGASWEALVFGAHEDEDGTETNMLTYDPLGGVNIIEDRFVFIKQLSQLDREGGKVRMLGRQNKSIFG